ncbi:MAG: SGNH/GDSL hydrolase family protein [Candidatus Eisenbacteria bacterium]
MKRLLFRVAGLLLALLVAELFSAAGFVFLERYLGIAYSPADRLSPGHAGSIRNLLEGKHRYIEHSPILGWRVRSNGESSLYRANSDGIRSGREYEKDPPPGTLRIAAFGDSFTHGDDVAGGEEWPALLESAGDGWEVLNFGVPGYGTDQAYLRYLEEGVRFSPDIVLIGFMTENIGRHLSVFRPFYRPGTGVPLGKPRFLEDGDRLVLVPNPLARLDDYRSLLDSPGESIPALGADDAYFADRYLSHPLEILRTFRLIRITEEAWRKWRRYGGGEEAFYRESSEHLTLTLRIFEEFRRSALENGSETVILVFPQKSDIRRFRKTGTMAYASLLEEFDRRGYRYADLTEVLGNGEGVFSDQGRGAHYSAEGNRRIAGRVREEILCMGGRSGGIGSTIPSGAGTW